MIGGAQLLGREAQLSVNLHSCFPAINQWQRYSRTLRICFVQQSLENIGRACAQYSYPIQYESVMVSGGGALAVVKAANDWRCTTSFGVSPLSDWFLINMGCTIDFAKSIPLSTVG